MVTQDTDGKARHGGLTGTYQTVWLEGMKLKSAGMTTPVAVYPVCYGVDDLELTPPQLLLHFSSVIPIMPWSLGP